MSGSDLPSAYPWTVNVFYAIEVPYQQAEEAAGRAFTRDADDDDSFETALQAAAAKALKDPGSWLSRSIANTEPEVEVE